ncbi:MAG: hypothetical protein BWY76_03462 [bacterium ADurb.Bin429]|nr:MAG: hypothetical protein BWY76_03462 [bacterium ADurb.Bin429]
MQDHDPFRAAQRHVSMIIGGDLCAAPTRLTADMMHRTGCREQGREPRHALDHRMLEQHGVTIAGEIKGGKAQSLDCGVLPTPECRVQIVDVRPSVCWLGVELSGQHAAPVTQARVSLLGERDARDRASGRREEGRPRRVMMQAPLLAVDFRGYTIRPRR